MGKSKKKTTTTSADAATVAQQQQLYNYANKQAAMGAPGADPYSVMAAQQYGNIANSGATNLGLGAMMGNGQAVQQLMNPYQSQVMDAMNQQYGVQRQQNMNDVNARATQAGAFGGSRYGVALGQAMATTNRDQNAQQANLLQGGYSDAMNRAGQLVNFGMGATGQMANMGDYLRNIQLQQQGYGADTIRGNMYKTGDTTTQTEQGNAMSTLGGVASLGMGLFGGPIGGAVMGAAGKLLGGGAAPFIGAGGSFMSSPGAQSLFGNSNFGMRP